ncbi:hypothetical protein JRO89_XS15G0133100 [Xanthoceras sorbifolium]|uniref:Cyclin-like domain-containing protein n=1 Tax=Xanthoceras sorbifolium TaxID=99658 RepID=A0ABQ8H215_9ROSI|nr:hypothetical protein JRO89_XS15G0133100 [Xanthoceras sorbifolium]
MEYDPTSPLVRERAAFERYFAEETNSMAVEGYANRLDASILRKRALILLDRLSKKEKDASIAYLALSYFDRFLSREELKVEDLDLAVICCLFLASKMRNNSFSVHLFLTTTPDVIVNQELILEMETRILNALDWRLRSVNALCFVGYFIQLLQADLRPSPKMVNEIIVQAESDIDFTQYRPSVIAASATFTASSIQFPGRFQECLDSFMSCDHVNMVDLNKCTEMIKGICKKKHVLGATFQDGAASSSSSAFHRPIQEAMHESSETMEEIERRPEKEIVPESLEIMAEIERIPGKEAVPESSETIEEIPRRPGKEPIEESLEMTEEIQSDWETLMEDARRGPRKAPTQEISEITEEPESEDEKNMMNFQIKWITDEEERLARDYFRLSVETHASSVDVSSVAAERGSNPDDTDRYSYPDDTDRHSTQSDNGDNTSSVCKCFQLK